MRIYKKSKIEGLSDVSVLFPEGLIFGYTNSETLKSKSVYLEPKIAKSWGAKHGITHEEVFGIRNLPNRVANNIFTWAYDIKEKELNGVGIDAMPRKVRSAAMSEVYAKLGDI
jgi:hypothetical protein